MKQHRIRRWRCRDGRVYTFILPTSLPGNSLEELFWPQSRLALAKTLKRCVWLFTHTQHTSLYKFVTRHDFSSTVCVHFARFYKMLIIQPAAVHAFVCKISFSTDPSGEPFMDKAFHFKIGTSYLVFPDKNISFSLNQKFYTWTYFCPWVSSLDLKEAFVFACAFYFYEELG